MLLVYYSEQLTDMIGEGAYDCGGHRNAQFPGATNVGSYPGACMRAWKSARDEAMQILGLRDDPEQEGWEKMGPLADPTPASVKNRGAAERRRRRGDDTREETVRTNVHQMQPAATTDELGDEAQNMDGSEMDELRAVVCGRGHTGDGSG